MNTILLNRNAMPGVEARFSPYGGRCVADMLIHELGAANEVLRNAIRPEG